MQVCRGETTVTLAFLMQPGCCWLYLQLRLVLCVAQVRQSSIEESQPGQLQLAFQTSHEAGGPWLKNGLPGPYLLSPPAPSPSSYQKRGTSLASPPVVVKEFRSLFLPSPSSSLAFLAFCDPSQMATHSVE